MAPIHSMFRTCSSSWPNCFCSANMTALCSRVESGVGNFLVHIHHGHLGDGQMEECLISGLHSFNNSLPVEWVW